MKNTTSNYRPARTSAGRFASAALLAAFATMAWSGNANAAACLEDAYGGDVNCTANDIAVASIAVTEVLDSCDGTPGDTFTFNGTLNVQPTATTRYDIGFYIGSDPEASLADDCFVGVIDPTISDADTDSCGDTISSAPVSVPVTNVTAPCQDADDDGFFDVNTCSSWKQTADIDCTGPAQAVPGTKSKCNCEVVQTDIVVPYCATNVDCDDANVCTDDICNTRESGLGDDFGCSHTNNSAPCEDGLFCNGADVCSGGTCVSPGDPCLQGDVCDNTCNEAADNCLVTAGTTCRSAAGVCDAAETCTGTSAACPANEFLTTECRASAGVCDAAETCTGSSASCPADAFLTTECRAEAGVCDTAETCTGSSASCPADLFLTTLCRASAGVCDTAETCTGSAASCPADQFLTTLCRASAGVCDAAETCTGASASCPADSFLTIQCRAAGGICDAAETCTGSAATCPQDVFGTEVCRPAAGVCDAAESCTGQGGQCPADAFLTTQCRGAAGVCDTAETCTGSSASCPANAFLTTQCRASAGVCDAAETCTGAAASCPVDAFVTTLCRASAGVCDAAETCTGAAASCPADAFLTTQCRASAGVCDAAETCTGAAASCPADAFLTTQCRAAAGVCDTAETCTGSSASCPANAFLTTQCRASAGICDVAEACTGSSASCPVNAFQPSGTACTNDQDVCTNDVCNASGQCNHVNNTANCDDAKFCTVNDKCSGGECSGTARQCGDEIACTTESCNEQTDSCQVTPNDEVCEDDDFCTTDTCDIEVGCRHVFSCNDICRRPSWYGKRAGDDGDNIVQGILDSVGGLEVCGELVDETSFNDSVEGLGLSSALEGLCVRVGDHEQRALYRELVAAALNCAMSGAINCNGALEDFDISFEDCSDACESGVEDSFTDLCTRRLDCYNSGGSLVDGMCAYGTCDVTKQLCGGQYGVCPPIALVTFPLLQVCERFSDNCRDEEFCNPGLDICPTRVKTSSSGACKEAKKNSCTIDDCFDYNPE